MRYAGDEGGWDDGRGDEVADAEVSEAGERHHGVLDVAGDELEEGVSTPTPVAQTGDHVVIKPPPDLSTTPMEVERPEEKILLDVSEKPKSDGNEAGKTEPGAMVMAQVATEEEQATPHVKEKAESPAPEPPSDKPTPKEADADATRTPPRQPSPQVRVPDAFTGIGSVHSFELDGLDDEFGIASFAKGLDLTGTTTTTTTDMGTTVPDTSLVTGLANDDNETKDKHLHSSNDNNARIDIEMK